MQKFSYRAKNKNGETVTGSILAVSKDMAASQLIRSNLTPLAIQVAQDDDVLDIIVKYFRIGQPGREELILFSSQMKTMLEAGVPLMKSLKVVIEATHHELLKNNMSNIAIALESGFTLSSAMKQYPETFPKIFTSMINVGENTGHLEQAFGQVSYYLELERDTSRRINSAMRYPIFVLFTIFMALIVINILVIPAFREFFASLKADLPWITKALIDFSSFVLNYWVHMAVISSLIAAGIMYWVSQPDGDLFWAEKKLQIPVIGGIVRKALLARFCRSFAMMLQSGVPLLEALKIVSGAVDNSFMEKKILRMNEGLEKGESLTKVAQDSGLFTLLVLQMLAIGEETGDIHKMLTKVASQYEDDVDFDLKRLSQYIEPILISIIAFLVLILALGIFLPMWEISTQGMAKS